MTKLFCDISRPLMSRAKTHWGQPRREKQPLIQPRARRQINDQTHHTETRQGLKPARNQVCDQIAQNNQPNGPLKCISEQQKPINERIDRIASQLLNEEVTQMIKTTTTYPRILCSKDPVEFMDITLIQWDSCSAGVLCLLRNELRRLRILPTQALLIRICKLTARKIHADHQIQLSSKPLNGRDLPQ